MWLYLQNETNFFSEKLKVLHIAPEQEFLRKFKKMDNLITLLQIYFLRLWT
jgi:hypothetical protein